jgi:hypothetical protein
MKFKKEGEPPEKEEEEKKEEGEEEKKEEEEEKKEEETEKSATSKTRLKKEDGEGEKKDEEEEKKEEGEEKKEEETEKSAPTGFVKAADIEAIVKSAVNSAVSKAVKPLQKQIDAQTTQLRKSELEMLAKSDLEGIGKSSEVADLLFQVEKSDLPDKYKTLFLNTMKSAAVVKKEAGKYLFSPMGANIPAPGSAAEEFEGLVKKEMETIQKSADAPKDLKVLRAQAITRLSKSQPALARKVLDEEKAESFQASMGVR